MAKSKKQTPQPDGVSTPTIIDRALAIIQPWAWLVAAGYKRIENRKWTTGYRGLVAIHASASDRDMSPEIQDDLIEAWPPLEAVLNEPEKKGLGIFFQHGRKGEIVGVAELVGIHSTHEVDELDCKFPPKKGQPPLAIFAEGPECWQFENAVYFEKHIPCRGLVSLFRLPPDVSKKVTSAYLAATASR